MDIDSYVGQGGKMVSNDHLKEAEIIAFYFSASWCQPCKMFTPVLSKFYEVVNKDKRVLEVVFFSADSDQQSFDSYFGTMPWLAAPWTFDRASYGTTLGV